MRIPGYLTLSISLYLIVLQVASGQILHPQLLSSEELDDSTTTGSEANQETVVSEVPVPGCEHNGEHFDIGTTYQDKEYIYICRDDEEWHRKVCLYPNGVILRPRAHYREFQGLYYRCKVKSDKRKFELAVRTPEQVGKGGVLTDKNSRPCEVDGKPRRHRERWISGMFIARCLNGEYSNIRCLMPNGHILSPKTKGEFEGNQYKCEAEVKNRRYVNLRLAVIDKKGREAALERIPASGTQEQFRCHHQCPDLMPKRDVLCTLTGDPHTFTFDRASQHYQGTCWQTVAVGTDDYDGPKFRVSMKTEHRSNEARIAGLTVSYVSHLRVVVENDVVTILAGGIVKVNGVRVSVPYAVSENENGTCGDKGRCKMTVLPYAGGYKVSTDFGLSVAYDGKGISYVSLQNEDLFLERVHGTCGYFDHDRHNDMRMPDGTVAETFNEFGDSWVEERDNKCVMGNKETPTCDKVEEEEAISVCEILTDPYGPFEYCLEEMQERLEEFRRDCVFDMCAYGNVPDVACMAVEPAADVCYQKTKEVIKWRTEQFCPPKCPEGQIYKDCLPAIPKTCAVPNPEKIPTPKDCSSGCACPEDKVIDNGECIEPTDCGCLDRDGIYRAMNTSYTIGGCLEVCRCLGRGKVQCMIYECPGETTCLYSDKGFPECRCPKGMKLEGEKCVEKPKVTTTLPPIIPPADNKVPSPEVPLPTFPPVPPEPPSSLVDPAILKEGSEETPEPLPNTSPGSVTDSGKGQSPSPMPSTSSQASVTEDSNDTPGPIPPSLDSTTASPSQEETSSRPSTSPPAPVTGGSEETPESISSSTESPPPATPGSVTEGTLSSAVPSTNLPESVPEDFTTEKTLISPTIPSTNPTEVITENSTTENVPAATVVPSTNPSESVTADETPGSSTKPTEAVTTEESITEKTTATPSATVGTEQPTCKDEKETRSETGRCVCKPEYVRYPDGKCDEMVCSC